MADNKLTQAERDCCQTIRATMPRKEPPPIKPQELNKLAWLYEEPKGLTVCVQLREGIDAGVVTIPWRKVREIAKRHPN